VLPKQQLVALGDRKTGSECSEIVGGMPVALFRDRCEWS